MTYRAPIQDMLFCMKELAGLEEVAKLPGFEDAGIETAQAVLEECARFNEGVVAPLNVEGDRNPSTFQSGVVTTTPGFAQAFRQFGAGGWQGLQHPAEFGGQGLPKTIGAACIEMLNSASLSFALCPLLTDGAIEALLTAGTPEQQQLYLPKMISGEWTGTMNLTEPQAGSDLALVRTRAEPQADGSYKLFGTKIFITYGEHDMAANIVHLVLARVAGAPEGVKGISLFICPKFKVNEDGSLGERNDVRCVSIEHKMGIHASPTCVLSYGDEGGAVGYLVGEPNQGMRAMFTMMNSARLAVGVQGVAIGDAAYQKALAYSQERRQGKEIGSDSHEPALIIEHPDVRRMLLFMRSHIEACRGIIVFNAAALDLSRALEGDDAERWREVCELLTPISKAWCTDVGVEVTSTAIQVFGGMGFIEESGVAQHYRDMRIAPIYEGTNGIQAMDLVGRKLPMRMGGVMGDFVARMRETQAELSAAGGDLDVIATNLADAIDQLETATNWIMTNGLADPKQALAGATPYLRLFGIVAGGWVLGRQALAARAELEAGSNDAAYLGAKVTTARYYADQHLPQAAGLVAAVQAGDGDLYAVDGETLASV
jgi:alkylation response protein AidB-like acyl-CoA dehydrogenase